MKGTLVKNRHVLLQERGLVGEEGGEGCYQHSFPLIRWSVLQRGSPEGTLPRLERILHLNNLCTSSFWLSRRAESRSSVSVPLMRFPVRLEKTLNHRNHHHDR